MSVEASIDLTETEDDNIQEQNIYIFSANGITSNPNFKTVSLPAKMLVQNITKQSSVLQELLSEDMAQSNANNKPFIQTQDVIQQSDELLIKYLQKENPNIETVFIDSDEEETSSQSDSIKPRIQIHNNIVLKSPSMESNPLTTDSKETPSASTTSGKSSPTQQVIDMSTYFKKSIIDVPAKTSMPVAEGNTNPLFKVTEVSSLKVDKNIVHNATTTIAVQTVKEGKVTTRYLVIPREVAPVLAKSKGPLSLNIPGIGPLVINKPSDIVPLRSENSIKPFSLNFQDILDQNPPKSQPTQNLSSMPKLTPIYDPLNDKKFPCWSFVKGRKRDLEGFSLIDRLGFYKVEQDRSRKCMKLCNDLFNRLQESYREKINERNLFRDTNVSGIVKIVEIDDITRKHTPGKTKCSRIPHSSTSVSNQTNTFKKLNTSFSPYNNIISTISFLTSSSEDDDDNDKSKNNLLLTKKVVFLNEETVKRRGRKKKIHRCFNPNIQKYEGTKVGRPSKEEAWQKKLAYYKKLYNIKPCYVDCNPNKQYLQAMKISLECKQKMSKRKPLEMSDVKIINNLKDFRDSLQPIKPLLIINKDTCHGMQFKNVFCKYNIIFPVDGDHSFPTTDRDVYISGKLGNNTFLAKNLLESVHSDTLVFQLEHLNCMGKTKRKPNYCENQDSFILSGLRHVYAVFDGACLSIEYTRFQKIKLNKTLKLLENSKDFFSVSVTEGKFIRLDSNALDLQRKPYQIVCLCTRRVIATAAEANKPGDFGLYGYILEIIEKN